MMDELLDNTVSERRLAMLLLSAFAVLALVLVTLGIYGVMAFTVGQRTHEIGIRMALGARRASVLALVVRRGMTLVLIGLAVGLAATYGLTRLLRSLLFGVEPTDPLILGTVPVFLALVALAACYLPARRAAGVDPLLALRSE
jgi:putative ABC transport system permease protein